jgi:hypothetical protein
MVSDAVVVNNKSEYGIAVTKALFGVRLNAGDWDTLWQHTQWSSVTGSSPRPPRHFPVVHDGGDDGQGLP